MTFSTSLHAGRDCDGYTVTRRGGCTLVAGSMPMDHFTALTKVAPKASVMSPHLARLASVSLAWGLQGDVDALVMHLIEQRQHGLPARGLDRWLQLGEHGASSLAIVQHLTGKCVADDPTAHPHDPDDLGRCVSLLEMAPELRPDLPKMATVSAAWAALVARWDELEGCLNAEAPGWRESGGSAHGLYATMRSILAGAV